MRECIPMTYFQPMKCQYWFLGHFFKISALPWNSTFNTRYAPHAFRYPTCNGKKERDRRATKTVQQREEWLAKRQGLGLPGWSVEQRQACLQHRRDRLMTEYTEPGIHVQPTLGSLVWGGISVKKMWYAEQSDLQTALDDLHFDLQFVLHCAESANRSAFWSAVCSALCWLSKSICILICCSICKL